MQTEALQYLLTVAKTNSLNKASNLLNIPYQSINYALQNLESELQTKILDRTPSGTFLTDSGNLVKEFSEKFLKEFDILKKTLAQNELEQREKNKHTLSICSITMLQNTIIPQLILSYEKKYPNSLLFSYSNNTLANVLSLMQTKEIDIYFTLVDKKSLSELKANPDIQYQVLGKSKLYLICSRDHTLAEKNSITTKEFLNYPIALFKPTPAIAGVEVMLSNYAHIHYGQITDNISIFLNSIRQEKMIGLSCTYKINKKEILLLSKENPDLQFIPFEDFPATYCCVLMPKHLSKEKELMFDQFLSLFSQL